MRGKIFYLPVMKKALIMIIFSAMPVLCFSQASSGIKIGGGMYSLSGIKSEPDYGYEGGFFSKAEIGKKTSLLVELDYSVKKAKVTEVDTPSVIELNFVNFRFGIAWDFAEDFFLAAGPSFSYMIEAKQKPEIIPASYFTHFAVGIDPCVGYESGRFIAMLRYEASVTVLTLESTPKAAGNILTGVRFSGLKLGAGVKF